MKDIEWLLQKIDKKLIRLWKVHKKGTHKTWWFCTYRLKNEYYDTSGYETIEEALMEVYKETK